MMFQLIYKHLNTIKNKLNEKGQGMVEYAIIIAVVAAIAVAVLGTGTDTKDKDTLAGTVNNAFSTAKDKVNDAAGKTQQEGNP